MNYYGTKYTAAVCGVLLGCGVAEGDAAQRETELQPASGEQRGLPPLEVFLDGVRQTVQMGEGEVDVYVLEGDMIVSLETAVAYYDALYPSEQEKSVGFAKRANGPVVPQLQRRSVPIRYCFDTTFSSSQLATVSSNLLNAANAWSRVANIRFERVTQFDGRDCIVDNEVADIVVTRATSVNEAPFPGAFPPLMRMVATAGASDYLHELGHVLGFGHEQFHSKSGLGCTIALPNVPSTFGVFYQDLNAAWDPASVMQYRTNGQPSCAGRSDAVVLSKGDGEGARKLYP